MSTFGRAAVAAVIVSASYARPLTGNERKKLLRSIEMSDQPESATPAVPPPARRNPAGYAVLGLAVVAALAVGVYLFVSGGDDNSGPEPAATIAGFSGVPNPYPDTGPLDPNRPVIGETAPNFALVDARDTSIVRELKDTAAW